jgi:outer membrane protein OmpA-like peptidoglycan-associated protein
VNRTPLEAVRNYQQEIRSQGGKILFECKDIACGGDAARASSGGGGEMSVAMYLMPEERIKDKAFSCGWCAQLSRIADQRYFTAEIPSSGASVSVLAYTVNDHGSCKALAGRTIVIADILEAKAREQKMITMNSGEMAKEMALSGSVALYGIYFDFNKADLKAESEPALSEIAKLMKGSATLKLLVVGHTDRAGTLQFNMDLSQRRAAAVVDALAGRYQVERARLTPIGVAYASPKASNKTEEGRARNRRVELVEN